MTHIVDFPTKKSFKAAVANGEDPWLSDPSIFDPCSGRVSEVVRTPADHVTVTNHPKRSWFASVEMNTKTRQIVVK